MIIEKLTEKEMKMLESYRDAYAYNFNFTHENDIAEDMSYILREWDFAKQNLFKMLDGHLMLQKHLEYTKSYEELQAEINDFTYSRFGRAGRSGSTFINEYYNYIDENYNTCTWKYGYDAEKAKIGKSLLRLVSDDCLISNKYDGNSFSILTKNGKEFKVMNGCKVSKVLGKLALIFNLNGYEDFRICHSQVLNQKTLDGTMTISIHPMDYMTMSDNNCGWDSCMSWSQEGCYRQGTVEMMNSPTVIVAYLAADTDMEIPGSEQNYWNSKKWRQLFVVDRNVIASVKDYPYHNEDLSKMVIDWLKELATTNLGWTYEDEAIRYKAETVIPIPCLHECDKNSASISFITNNMYNDFGCLDCHWVYLSNKIEESSLKTCWGQNVLNITYSGLSECMVCGELSPDFESESCLVCDNCQSAYRCEYCDEILDEDNQCEVDGIHICESCWEYEVRNCEICEEYHLKENMTGIYIIPEITNERKEKLERNKSFLSSDSAEEQTIILKAYSPNIWICTKHEISKIKESYLNPGANIYVSKNTWSDKYYVYYNDLTPEAKDHFLWNYGNEEEYFNYLNFSQTPHKCQLEAL